MPGSQLKAPTRSQLFILRLMILMGVVCIGFFLRNITGNIVMGYRPLYWLLLATFIYTFFKILYEWYHYWSISIPKPDGHAKNYSVDIFTTFCAGEPYEMIMETLTAIQNITYPHTTYLCDEADDAYLRSVCDKLGVKHVTRLEKIDAKAGNINNALKRSSGDLCVILDPDHIPAPDFLDKTVGYFNNPDIGYVQVIQAYYNQGDSWIAKAAAQQTYQFYGPMMMCMNSYGTVQAQGANCVFRRNALNSIGGHAAGLAEDMHTAMQLHAKGWKSIYVPEIVSRGLVPATLSAYFKQQLKWSRGSFELLLMVYPKLFKQFTWRQKLHYGLQPLFYLSGFVFLINFLIPIVSLFTNVFPLGVDFDIFFITSVPFLVSVVLMRHYVQQWVAADTERGFHVAGGLLLIGTWWVFITGFVYTLIRKEVPYIATPKDKNDEKNLRYNLPNLVVLLVSLAAIVYGLYDHPSPFTHFMAGIAGLNCVFMACILVAGAEFRITKQVNRRKHVSAVFGQVRAVKSSFWLFRRRVYNATRSASLVVLVVCLSYSVYLFAGQRYNAPYNIYLNYKADMHLAKKHPFTKNIQILRPALTVVPDSVLGYHVLNYRDNRWQLATKTDSGITYKWFLVQANKWGDAEKITTLGEGAVIWVKMPYNAQNYRLYLIASGKNVREGVISTLNMPLRQN